MARKPKEALRRGWTTGSCATAASKAAFEALLTNRFPDPVTITLPSGREVAFALSQEKIKARERSTMAAVVKDAGDDPDVTHRATICARVTFGPPKSGIVFRAGEGVGTITKPGLPLPVGEAAVNPVPRQMIKQALAQVIERQQGEGHPFARFLMPAAGQRLERDQAGFLLPPQGLDLEITLSVPEGRKLAQQTWNPRLGILGGLSILGTTGIVVPFSCSSWIHSIHRGIDVAIANNRHHVAGCTGRASEKALQAHYGLDDGDMLDMGDFAGGLLKYLARHPVSRLTIGGGFGKLTKLAMGHMDLHSGRSQVDMNWLADEVISLMPADDESARQEMKSAVSQANTANQVLSLCQEEGIPIGKKIAEKARDQALTFLQSNSDGSAAMILDVMIINRAGRIVAQSDSKSTYRP